MNYSMVATVCAYTLTRYDAMLKPFAFPAGNRSYALTGLQAGLWHGGNTVMGITINAAILETLQGFSTQRNVLKGVTIAVGTGAQIMQLKVVDRNHEPIEGATCRVLNAIGGSNNVLSFDGVDDYTSVPNSSTISPTQAISVEIFAKPNVVNKDFMTILEKPFTAAASPFFDYAIGFDNTSKIRFRIATSEVKDTANAVAGQWHHIVGTYNKSQIKLYINNNLRATTNFTSNINQSGMPLVFGKSTNYAGRFFNGSIAEVRLWSVARTPEEIAEFSNKRLQGNEANLLEYWKIDEGTGTLINGLTNNGTIYGAPWAEADESFPLYDNSIQGYDPTPYDSQTTNANGLTTLNYQINTIHGLEVTLPGKRRFIMPFQRTTRGLLDWQVMLSDYLATFATDRGNILINSEPENNDATFLIE